LTLTTYPCNLRLHSDSINLGSKVSATKFSEYGVYPPIVKISLSYTRVSSTNAGSKYRSYLLTALQSQRVLK